MLNLESNLLQDIPSDVGWLPLETLKLGSNPDLRIPPIVLERGHKWVHAVQMHTAGGNLRHGQALGRTLEQLCV